MSETDIIRKIKEKCGRTQIKILHALFENSKESLLIGTDRLRFRANNPQWIEEIDSMENDQFLIKHSKDSTRIRISVFSLPLLDYSKASRYLNLMDKLVPILSTHYREAFDSPISINILQKKLDAEIRELLDVLYFFCEIGGLLRAVTPDPPSIDSTKFAVYEKILNTNSAREKLYETFSWRLKYHNSIVINNESHPKDLSLIGTWKGDTATIISISEIIKRMEKTAVRWDTGINDANKELLRTPFFVYFNIKDESSIRYRFRVIDYKYQHESTRHTNPWPETKIRYEVDLTQSNNKNDHIWLLIDQVLILDRPLEGGCFESILPWKIEDNPLNEKMFRHVCLKPEFFPIAGTVISQKPTKHASRHEYVVAEIDSPTTVDSLGRTNLAKALASLLSAKEQKSPFTFAILGEWGTGKTTLIRMISNLLKENNKDYFEFSHFNAWAYEACPNMPAALAHEIISSLIRDKPWRRRLWLSIRFALENRKEDLAWITILFITSIISVIVAATIWPNIILDKQKILLGLPAFVIILFAYYKACFFILGHPFTSHFKNFITLPKFKHHLGITSEIREKINLMCMLALNSATSANKSFFSFRSHKNEISKNEKRLIIFIDDLDRCRPSQILNVLEAVGLVTGIENVFVVLAIDPRILLESARFFQRETNNDTNLNIDLLARDYLGKIFQLVVSLDELESRNIDNFISTRLFHTIRDNQSDLVAHSNAISGNNDHNISDEIDDRKFTIIETKTNKYEPDNLDIVSPLQNTHSEMQCFIESSELFNIKNPRQLIRLHNSYNLLKILKPDSLYVDEGNSLIKMLFFKEFLQELRSEDKMSLENYILGKQEKPTFSKVSDNMAEAIRSEINKCFGSFLDPLEYTRFVKLSSSVNRFVIPSI